MKKFFIFLAILIGIAIAAVCILGAIAPKDVRVSRSIIIKAPKEAVFEQMVKFKNWTNWSPWYKMDSTMNITYSGTDGQPGSGYKWLGGEKTGAGEMKNLSVNGTAMNFSISFIEPHSGKAQGILQAADTAGATKATWTFDIHNEFPMNAMGVFMNMDKMLGGDFESGLSNMKKYVENHLGPQIEIKEVDYPAHIYEGVRQVVFWNEMMKFFGDNLGMLAKGLGGKITGPASGIYYDWDTVNQRADIVVAFPVYDTMMPVKGASFTHVDASKAYMAVQKGDYSGLMEVHKALAKYCIEKGKMVALYVEEYPVGPLQEPDSTKWVTNVYYLVK